MKYTLNLTRYCMGKRDVQYIDFANVTMIMNRDCEEQILLTEEKQNKKNM